MSKRKPHNEHAGYVAMRRNPIVQGGYLTIYDAKAQGLDVGDNRYAVVCSAHAAIVGEPSIRSARLSMKYPDFCERCMVSARQD